jgi:hypothetical protein
MELRDLTPEAIKAAIKEFYEVTSGHVGRIVKAVGNERISLPRTPRKLGTYQFDYFFAADIDQLARYALGGMQASRSFVLELCETVEGTLFTCASGVRVPAPAEWYDAPLGFIVRASRARAALRQEEGPPLDADAVRTLADRSDKVLKVGGLLKKGGDSPEDVRAFFEKEGIPV